MPASTPASPSRPGHPQPAVCGDDAGVSEVIGYILIFGIISILLVVSMLAFNVAQVAARDRVVGLRADSAAARVSGIVVQTSLIAEQQGVASQVRFLVDLKPDLEGLPYQVSLVPTAGGVPAHIGVTVPRDSVSSTAALFSADAASSTAGFDICGGTIAGGRLNVRFDVRTAVPAYTGVAAGCPAGTHTYALFLESAP